ncbi:MAG TPA: hypothetical protein ENI86_00200 [Acidimicrobiales bacterium]|nr:hypothetical protein [Acidimicrobiales bacterium]
MALLRASSQAVGIDVGLSGAVSGDGAAGIENSVELLRFAEAVQQRSTDLDDRREALRAAVGDLGLIEAAATVSGFNGLVRVADGTGIQIDEGVDAYTADVRGDLGIDRYSGAANTPDRGLEHYEITTVKELF